MDLPYKRQSQFELFPGASANPGETSQRSYILRAITLPPENIIVLCIILLMVFVLSFSMGVERGRKAVPAIPSPQEKIPLQNKNNAIITPLSKPATVSTIAAKQPNTQGSSVNPKAVNKNVPLQIVSGVNASIQTAMINKAPAVVVPVVSKPTKPLENFNYTIQVASYKQASFAQKEADRLKLTGLDAFVVGKGNYSIVCVGKFIQTADAKKMTSKLKGRYKDYLIRSL